MRTSDYGRARRQRQLLWALRDQMLDGNLVLRLPELWTALDGKYQTDLSLLDFVNLAQFGLPLSDDRVRAGALTDRELQPFISPAGAQVLRVANLTRVQETIDNVWNAETLAEVNHNEPDECKPPPRGAPIFDAAEE